MVDVLGIFLTHSAADLQWPELARLAGPQNAGQTDHNNALIENPTIVDRLFYHSMQKFVDVFYDNILVPQISGYDSNGSIKAAHTCKG